MFNLLSTIMTEGLTRDQWDGVWRFMIVLALVFHWTVVYDAVPGFETGFAKVSTVRKLQETVDKIQETQLLEAIEKERRNVCEQLASSNGAAAAYAANRRSQLLRDYTILTGRNAESVSCEELGIS